MPNEGAGFSRGEIIRMKIASVTIAALMFPALLHFTDDANDAYVRYAIALLVGFPVGAIHQRRQGTRYRRYELSNTSILWIVGLNLM